MLLSEKKYIIFASIFAIILFIFIIPYWQKTGLSSVNPLIQFALFNVGTFFIFQILFKSITTKKSVKFKGALGLLLLFSAIDILQPPYLVTTGGQMLSGAILSVSSSDYIAGYLGSLIGLTGYLLYLFTYIAIPLILFLIAGKLIKNFVREL